MDTVVKDLVKSDVTVVIPCYRVGREIGPLIANLPSFLKHIIVVDDASPDETVSVVMTAAKSDPRIILLSHQYNQGVGGAMLTGFRKALELSAQIVVKIDGDGQMDPAHCQIC